MSPTKSSQRRRLSRLLPWALAMSLFMLTLAGCGDEDEDENAVSGTAPELSGLTYDDVIVPLGVVTTIDGMVHFSDPDGDVQTLHLALVQPDGARSELAPSQIGGTAGMTEGDLALILSIGPVMTGTHEFEVFVRDAGGNSSNTLSGTVNAE